MTPHPITRLGRYLTRGDGVWRIVAILREHDCAVGLWEHGNFPDDPHDLDTGESQTWDLDGRPLGVGAHGEHPLDIIGEA